jgi:hypothetical protein
MNRCNRSLAAVVRMVKVSSSLPPESRQLSHGPAKAIGSPLVKAMA